jgi:hypothetical protein
LQRRVISQAIHFGVKSIAISGLRPEAKKKGHVQACSRNGRGENAFPLPVEAEDCNQLNQLKYIIVAPQGQLLCRIVRLLGNASGVKPQ